MFVELPGRPAREPSPMLTDPRGTGRYQIVTAANVLAVGPILTHRFDRLVAMPAGCLGLEACHPDGSFAVAGAEFGLHLVADLARGALPLDLDEDGRLDLIVPGATGPHRWLVRQIDGTFRDDASPAFAWPGDVSALAAGDFDDDGHEELLVVLDGEVRLFRLPDGRLLDAGALTIPPGLQRPSVADINADGRLEIALGDRLFQAPSAGGCLRVAVKSRFDGPAYGASVRLNATVNGVPRKMLRVLDPGTGYGRTHEPVAHFGLGRGATLESLTVHWPDGARRTLTGLTPDAVVVVPYPAG
jgi:hypothetical protein